MESYIQISKINDFLFCPRSVYLHTIYDNFHKRAYQRTSQIAGTLAHESIEKGTYSSKKRYLLGMAIYSDELGLCGKIDVYDRETRALVERKRHVKNVYDGYRYQLYAQMACMREMGYVVESLFIHSLTDNKRYTIEMPHEQEWREFTELIDRIKTLDVKDAAILENSPKCPQCIYQPLCHPLTPPKLI